MAKAVGRPQTPEQYNFENFSVNEDRIQELESRHASLNTRLLALRVKHEELVSGGSKEVGGKDVLIATESEIDELQGEFEKVCEELGKLRAQEMTWNQIAGGARKSDFGPNLTGGDNPKNKPN